MALILFISCFWARALQWPAMVGWNSCHLGSESFYGWWKMKKDSYIQKKTVWVKKTGVNTIPKSP